MSFLMLLQIPLKYLQLCKNLPTIFSGTYKSYICCVNNDGGSRNCLCKLTLRLRGRQGRCVYISLYRHTFTQPSSNLLCLASLWSGITRDWDGADRRNTLSITSIRMNYSDNTAQASRLRQTFRMLF